MKWEHYAVKEGKTLRYGYTTGTCAAAAASVAAEMSLSRKPVNLVRIKTPKGIVLSLSRKKRHFFCTAPARLSERTQVTTRT